MITFIQGRLPEKQAARRKEDVVEFVRKRLGFEPDEKQALALRSTAKRGILNCCRQWGQVDGGGGEGGASGLHGGGADGAGGEPEFAAERGVFAQGGGDGAATGRGGAWGWV